MCTCPRQYSQFIVRHRLRYTELANSITDLPAHGLFDSSLKASTNVFHCESALLLLTDPCRTYRRYTGLRLCSLALNIACQARTCACRRFSCTVSTMAAASMWTILLAFTSQPFVDSCIDSNVASLARTLVTDDQS